VHLTLALFVTITGKSLMSHPRPSWASDEIQAWACDPDFGNPSGHSLTSMTFASFSSNHYLLFLAFLVGYSRMVLGVHSLNQVVFG
jgi:membrane-associated phospholipid phosphatase